jgi:hypothetical protein
LANTQASFKSDWEVEDWGRMVFSEFCPVDSSGAANSSPNQVSFTQPAHHTRKTGHQRVERMKHQDPTQKVEYVFPSPLDWSTLAIPLPQRNLTFLHRIFLRLLATQPVHVNLCLLAH